MSTLIDLEDPSFLTQEQIDLLRRKFFVGPGDDQTFLKWGDQAMQIALEWLKNPEERKIHADISLLELADLFSDINPPEEGFEIEEIFAECRDTILNNSVRVNNPRYIGHMTSAIPWFSVAVDILITAMNQNQVKIETALASSYVERQTMCWLHRLVYGFEESYYQKQVQHQDIAFGNMTSGGTIGTLTALTVARERLLPGAREYGLLKALKNSPYEDVAILVSTRGHYSIKKSASVLGLGEDAVHSIPVDENNRIRLDILQKTIKRLQKNNVGILALVGIAGTTETGNVDPLEKLAALAKKHQIWFHVDAAWGGAVLLSKTFRHLLKGIEYADSTILDGHKLFYLPMPHGCVLFKDRNALHLLQHSANYVIRKGSVDLGRTTLEGSRSFNALKLWFSLKMLGMNGYEVLLKKSMRLTHRMKTLIDNHPDFERTSTPEIGILTYRFVPKGWQKQLEILRKDPDKEALMALNEQINSLNVELQKQQRESGKSFVSRTTLESTIYPQEIVVLRTILTNFLTRSAFLEEILEEQREMGYAIVNEMPNLLIKDLACT